MIQDIGKVYDNHFEPKEPTPESYVLHYRDRSGLVRVTAAGKRSAEEFASGEMVDLPRLADYPTPPNHMIYLFRIGDDSFFLALDDEVDAPAGYTYERVGWLRGVGPADLSFAAAVGCQLSCWYRDNRYCSRCGHEMQLAPKSREIVCPECARIVYPKIQPGIIAGVTDGERIVLTRYRGRALKLWALIAGFTEIGESIEDTVRREVMEEVGLKVRDLRFYKSQPWPFSDTLLVGFWCHVDGSKRIHTDHEELAEARWFAPDEIPLERSNDHASLTGEMIELFRQKGAAGLGL
ncbi:MAG: NAD(+) diphosphatase [Tractidigestivibacter sp.]|jgi:NAD+ diphosphatase|uniref:NAD(+) diphosphatase n=1 Tax=Tractidigestivibacter sp. TaxID=2847320 RepID=UPI003D8AA74C